MDAGVIAGEVEADAGDDQCRTDEIGCGGRAQQGFDADRALPHAAEERGEPGYERAAEIEEAHRGRPRVGGHDLEGGGEDVAHEEPAEETETDRREARRREGFAAAQRVQAGRAEQEASGQQPHARRPSLLIKPVREEAAAEHADEGRALQVGGRGEGGVGKVEREFVVEETRQPAIQEPEPENEDREGHAEHQVGRHPEQRNQREAGAGFFRFDLGVLLHTAEEEEIGDCVEQADCAEDEEGFAPLTALRHPAAEPGAPDGADDLRGGQHGDGAGSFFRSVRICREGDGRGHVEALGDAHRGAQGEQHERRGRETGGDRDKAPDDKAADDEPAFRDAVRDLTRDGAADAIDPEKD